MGLYDRDYYRESTRSNWSDWFYVRGTVWLIAITIGVYILQHLMATRIGNIVLIDPIANALQYDLARIQSGQIWRLFTVLFLHDPNSIWHIVFNMLALYFFGSMLEGVYGTREFVAFYIGAGVAAKTVETAIRTVAGQDEFFSIGASGATTALLVLFACLFPNKKLLLYFVLPVPAWVLVMIIIGLDLIGLAGVQPNRVNHVAHLMGALMGFIYYWFELRISSWLSIVLSWRRPSARPKLRVVPFDPSDMGSTPTPPEPVANSGQPTDEQLEAKLDQVLDKVNRSGRESLTPEENAILLRASEIYQKRRRPPGG
jgi:membrane associated rhomboid family serine protease